jgi:hypothetical protein
MLIWVILTIQCIDIDAQTNQCTQAAITLCGSFPCIQVGDLASCLCSDMILKPNAAQCSTTVATTAISSVMIPNQCANAICPNGATCIPTNQNPSRYICLCRNNIIANPDCPINVLPNNPCMTNNPCTNGGTCVINQLTMQAVCLCTASTYGPNCAYQCRSLCDPTW